MAEPLTTAIGGSTCAASGAPEDSASQARPACREVAMLGTALILCQVLDGVLTGIGVFHFGPGIEANLLLRSAMESIGSLEALVVFKLSAIIIVISLCYLSGRVFWIRTAMKALIAVYVFGAILPWGVMLFNRII